MANKPNVLMIVVDGLRADHLGCYGYPKSTSSCMDSLAAAGARSEALFCSTIPWVSSMASLLSGQHPICHEILSDDTLAEFPGEYRLLPEIFTRSRYTACGITNLRHARYWFGRGLEYSINPALRHKHPLDVTYGELNSRAIPWIRSHANEPFFLFIHYREPQAALAKARCQSGMDALPPYDEAIRSVDRGIQELVTALDESSLSSRTLLVVVADRGASLGEHGIACESRGLYDCTLRVPFIARWPERIRPGTHVSQLFQTDDIAPTLLEAVSLPAPSSMDGKSFWKALTGEQTVAGRGSVISLDYTCQPQWSLRTTEHKFIVSRGPDRDSAPQRELYDLVADPGEEHNLAAQCTELCASMGKDLDNWISRRLRELGKSEDTFLAQGMIHNSIGV
jgi:arylsulfatase